jgi:diguanylate cyclase (GGDEF)-like protein
MSHATYATFPFDIAGRSSWSGRRRHPRRDPGTVPIARAQAFLGGAATILGFLGIVLPHPDQFNVTGLLAVQAVALFLSGALLLYAGRLPLWILAAVPGAATVLTTLAIVFAGDATSAYAMLYLWVGLYAFYFASRQLAAIHVAFAVVSYTAVILLIGAPSGEAAPGGELHYLAVASGTLVVAGALLLYLRGRVERLMAKLTDAARTDLLTGLHNARGINELLETELERAKLNGSLVSLIVINPDRFREVNDRLGRNTGDEVLRGIARLAEQEVRRIDSVARTSGGEFAIVMPETGQDQAYVVAEQLLTRVRNSFRDREVAVTMSCGIATYPHHAGSAAELFTAADDALFAAQALGRDRAVVSSPEVETVMRGVMGPRASDAGSHLSTVLSLAEALDLREQSTASHSQSVGRYCELIGRELGFDDERIERLRLAGILHDIGKVGIPDSILLKPGPLEEEEWAHMRRHPELGARILGSRQLADIREWVMASHERPDGKGYPRGLRGEDIPLEARIVAVGDAFEAMTSDRVYRPGMAEEAALTELQRCAGTQFDAHVVEAFVHVLSRERSAHRVK